MIILSKKNDRSSSWSAITLSVVCLALGQQAQAGTPPELHCKPQTLVANYESPITCTAHGFDQSASPPILIQLDDNGQVKYRWEMNDTGMLGDNTAHDGIYSRRIFFKEAHAGTLTFALQNNPLATTTLTITGQPSFVEMLYNIWLRFRARQLVNS